MNEYIAVPVISLNEAVSALNVEPLDATTQLVASAVRYRQPAQRSNVFFPSSCNINSRLWYGILTRRFKATGPSSDLT